MTSLDVEDLKDTLTTTVLPKVVAAGGSLADAASSAASSLAASASDLATAGAERAGLVDRTHPKRWGAGAALAAVVAAVAGIGFVHRRKRQRAAADEADKD